MSSPPLLPPAQNTRHNRDDEATQVALEEAASAEVVARSVCEAIATNLNEFRFKARYAGDMPIAPP